MFSPRITLCLDRSSVPDDVPKVDDTGPVDTDKLNGIKLVFKCSETRRFQDFLFCGTDFDVRAVRPRKQNLIRRYEMKGAVPV